MVSPKDTCPRCEKKLQNPVLYRCARCFKVYCDECEDANSGKNCPNCGMTARMVEEQLPAKTAA